MESCPQCGSHEVEVTREVRPVAAALPEVQVDGVERWVCGGCGAGFDVWPEAAPLLALVARVVLAKPSRLTAGEFRWLRERLGWKGVELARRFGVTPEIVSKWERGKARITSQTDRLLRAMAALCLGVAAEGVRFEGIADDATPTAAHLVFGPGGWRVSAGGADADADAGPAATAGDRGAERPARSRRPGR